MSCILNKSLLTDDESLKTQEINKNYYNQMQQKCCLLKSIGKKWNCTSISEMNIDAPNS